MIHKKIKNKMKKKKEINPELITLDKIIVENK